MLRVRCSEEEGERLCWRWAAPLSQLVDEQAGISGDMDPVAWGFFGWVLASVDYDPGQTVVADWLGPARLAEVNKSPNLRPSIILLHLHTAHAKSQRYHKPLRFPTKPICSLYAIRRI